MQRHHKMAQHKRRRQKYGSLIDARENIQLVTENEHMSGCVERLSEKEFEIIMGIRQCKYCKRYIDNETKCIYWYCVDAGDCRYFDFDRVKYEENTNGDI